MTRMAEGRSPANLAAILATETQHSYPRNPCNPRFIPLRCDSARRMHISKRRGANKKRPRDGSDSISPQVSSRLNHLASCLSAAFGVGEFDPPWRCTLVESPVASAADVASCQAAALQSTATAAERAAASLAASSRVAWPARPHSARGKPPRRAPLTGRIFKEPASLHSRYSCVQICQAK
jgi:hypothetical protein